MVVHLYTLCWNEADMLGFFFRHYDPWVDRYFIYDDGSTDGSLAILENHPKVELRRFDWAHADSFVLSHQDFHNEAWKESRGTADWVIVTALDEHLQAKDWDNRDYLAACRKDGITAIPAIGYQMVSAEFPDPGERLATSRRFGAPYRQMNKLSIFDPDAILAPGFHVGRHLANPSGTVNFPPCDVMMILHYKYLGFEAIVRRHAEQAARLGATDRQMGWAHKYRWSSEELRADWDGFARRAVDIGEPALKPWRTMAPAHRWWRAADFADPEPAGTG